ncbi:uncharacterized protein LOC110866593 isoform X4 [Helianthus annuus]|uniref:uncharacterized protein LOC110866593 isoform X4 n=1 Tax=Helianthus annuus TaxID=4232 RepID=UPI000B8FD7FA|nr:uncharacterized protein LOC110866593 isoform X4 [Helianthus annuus]
MSSTISQTSCISAVHSRLHLRNRNQSPLQILRSKVVMMNNINGHAIKASTLESKSALNRTLKSHNAILGKPNSSTTEYVNGEEISEPTENVISEQRSAKIHDFCFGLPYGGIVLSGGLIGFIFSRNTASLVTGGLYGGALLALSVLSLKIWKQGQSSTPFILGQLGIAAALLWKNIQTQRRFYQLDSILF